MTTTLTSTGIQFPDSTIQITRAANVNYQAFTISGIWTKPAEVSANAIVIAQLWGGGGGGKLTAGGGGGGYATVTLPAASLPATVNVYVGVGGTYNTFNGDYSNFETYANAYGGALALSATTGGGGGGEYGPGVGSSGGSYGGGTGGATTGLNASSIWGGGGGGGSGASGNGGKAIWGGGGGGGNISDATGGTSMYGGRGGYATSPNGVAPGGGGGKASGNGARGEVRIWTIG
jgi:hypothetical protein